jgi:hypothetical protein
VENLVLSIEESLDYKTPNASIMLSDPIDTEAPDWIMELETNLCLNKSLSFLALSPDKTIFRPSHREGSITRRTIAE